MRTQRKLLSSSKENIKREERALNAQKAYLERLLILEKRRIHQEAVKMLIDLSSLRKEKAELIEMEKQLIETMWIVKNHEAD